MHASGDLQKPKASPPTVEVKVTSSDLLITQFFLDCVTTSFIIMSSLYNNVVFDLVFMLRIYQMIEIAKNIEDYWQL